MQFVRALHDFTKHSDYENKCVAFRKFIANNTDYTELQSYDADFVDPKKAKTGNEAPTTTDQRAPGQFTHRGTTFAYYDSTAPTAESYPPDMHIASSDDYTHHVASRISNAHIDVEIYDPETEYTYTFSQHVQAATARIRFNDGNRYEARMPVTTDRQHVLRALREAIVRQSSVNASGMSRTVLVGSYVFTQLEQLRTMGELSSVLALSGDSDDDEQYDSDDGDGS
jgi:hypothetical protein